MVLVLSSNFWSLSCEGFSFFPCRLGIYITSCYPVVSCIYIVSFCLFVSTPIDIFWDLILHLVALSSPHLLWDCRFFEFILVSVKVNSIHIGVTTDQLCLNQRTSNLIQDSVISSFESYILYKEKFSLFQFQYLFCETLIVSCII